MTSTHALHSRTKLDPPSSCTPAVCPTHNRRRSIHEHREFAIVVPGRRSVVWLHGLQTHWRNTHFLPTNILTHCILRPLPMHMHIHPPEILVDAVQGFALDLRAGAPARPGPVARWDALVQALWGHRGHPLICNMPLVRPHMPGSHVSVLQSALLGKQTADNGDMYDKKSLDAHSFQHHLSVQSRSCLSRAPVLPACLCGHLPPATARGKGPCCGRSTLLSPSESGEP